MTNRIQHNFLNHLHNEVGFALDFTPTHLSTYGGVLPQVLSSQDVSVNDVLHKCEIHQVSAITEENRRQMNPIKQNTSEINVKFRGGTEIWSFCLPHLSFICMTNPFYLSGPK